VKLFSFLSFLLLFASSVSFPGRLWRELVVNDSDGPVGSLMNFLSLFLSFFLSPESPVLVASELYPRSNCVPFSSPSPSPSPVVKKKLSLEDPSLLDAPCPTIAAPEHHTPVLDREVPPLNH